MEAMTQPEGGSARGQTEDQFTKTVEKYGCSTLIRLLCRCDRRNGIFLAEATGQGKCLLRNGLPLGSSWVYTTNW